jgi:alpha-beta hydrolase superfamily lysophospholipase
MESLLDHGLISERYFFPRPDQPESYRDFTASDGVRLRCFEQRRHPEGKTLVHYHGNGETVADYLHDFVEAIDKLGHNLLLVEYRGYGGSSGRPQLGKMLDDVRAVRQAAGLRPEDTFVYGRSVGAIFAVEWAFQEPRIGGLVLESGVANPHQRLTLRLDAAELGVDQEAFEAACAEHLDHQRKLAGYHGPLLVLHAAGDSLVTPDHARSHMEWAQGPEKTLVLFPRGDHNTILTYNWSEMLRHLAGFIG